MAVKKPRPIVIGNWKMNGVAASLSEIRLMAAMLEGVDPGCDVAVCPPATLIKSVVDALETSIIDVGGQDCHPQPSGAFTGDVSAEMIRDAGAAYVIVGHSERRQLHGESDALVREKAEAGHRAGLISVICVGETEDEREQGKTLATIARQVNGSVPGSASAANTILAYEPVWAIGSGVMPSAEQIEDVHKNIRMHLVEVFGADMAGMRILYGGSVKPQNAAAILDIADVDGGLIGHASLSAKDFLGIIALFIEQ